MAFLEILSSLENSIRIMHKSIPTARIPMQRQRHAEEVALNERKALMGSPEARQRRQQMQSEADLAGTSEGITASLQRTRQQMAQVCVCSQMTIQPSLSFD